MLGQKVKHNFLKSEVLCTFIDTISNPFYSCIQSTIPMAHSYRKDILKIVLYSLGNIYPNENIIENLLEALFWEQLYFQYLNMSKRLWTKTRQVGAKNSTQKLSKTKAKLSQAEPS